MDIIHHAAVGLAGGLAAHFAGFDGATAGFLLGSALPDLDALASSAGTLRYLRIHQGATHSLLVALPVAGAVGLLAGMATRTGFDLQVAIGLWSGVAVHALLDVSNTLGTALLWPLPRRWRLDAAFFVDASAWLLTALCLGALLATGSAIPFAAYAALLAGVLGLRAAGAAAARRATGAEAAIPDPVLPWRWRTTRRRPDGAIEQRDWSAFGGPAATATILPPPSPHALAIAAQSPLAAALRCVHRVQTVVAEDALPDGGLRVVLRDAAMSRCGGWYGEVTITADPEGRILDERARI